MSPQPSLARPVALVAVAAVVLAAGLYAQRSVQRIAGPLAIAVNGDTVAVAAPGVLYRLDGAGTLQGSDRDVVDPAAREAGLAWVGDALLVSPGRGGKLLRCTGTSCAPFSDDPYAPTGPVQVAPATAGRLWLAETAADRAHRYFEDGRRIDMPLSNLRQPGSLWQQDDLLYVCNTGAGRLERHSLFKRGIAEAETVGQFPAAADDRDPPVRPLRLLARGDGGFHVVLTNNARSRGQLAEVGADGSVQLVPVADLVNPVALAALGDALLVVDEDRMQVLRIGTDGKAAPFGDAKFRAALAAGLSTRDALRMAFPLLTGLGVLLAALGCSWLLSRLAGRRGNPPLPVAAGADGIAWLPTEASLAPRRALQQVAVMSPVALAPAIAADIAGYALPGIAWALVVIVAAAVPALLAGNRVRPAITIGLQNNKVLVVADPERGLNEYRLSQVAWNETVLQPAPAVSIPLTRDGTDLFHRPTLETALFPLLDAGHRIAG